MISSTQLSLYIFRTDLLDHSVFDSGLYCITAREVESGKGTDVPLHIPTYKSWAVIFCLPTFWLKFRHWSNIGIEVIIIDQSKNVKACARSQMTLIISIIITWQLWRFVHFLQMLALLPFQGTLTMYPHFPIRLQCLSSHFHVPQRDCHGLFNHLLCLWLLCMLIYHELCQAWDRINIFFRITRFNSWFVVKVCIILYSTSILYDFLFDFRTVPIVWYFLNFYFLLLNAYFICIVLSSKIMTW